VALEEALIANTAAVTRLADLMEKGGVPAAGEAATAASSGRGRPKGSTNAPKTPSFDEFKAVAYQLQQEKGGPVAVKLLQEHGGKLADIDPSKYASFIAAATVLLAEQPAAENSDDEL
jgi:hypothetical protein